MKLTCKKVVRLYPIVNLIPGVFNVTVDVTVFNSVIVF